jgi:hypothetical protein
MPCIAASSDYGHGGSDHGPSPYSPSILSHASGHQSSVEPYPAWSADRQIPMSTEEIEDIFLDLTHKFGFQRDSMRNMVCFTSSRPLNGANEALKVRLYYATS